MSLVAKGEIDDENEGTYQIWSSGLDDKEMCNPTHGAMFQKYEDDSDKVATGRCFMTKSSDKSPMTTKVCSILQSFNIPLSACDSELIAFTDAYFDTLVVSASNEAKK